MSKIEQINPNDLVLNLNEKANNYNLSKYEDFIYGLCGDRDYQQESIRRVAKFFLGKHYDSTEQLVRENFEKSETMQCIFKKPEEIVNQLEFKDKLTCTVDLATGTGKTWVMYGVAQIMLCEGVVDRVLVLCPSLTIKKEVSKKFESWAGDSNLKATLPKNSVYKNPHIQTSGETIKEGSICIDNIHKAYSHVSSSINDSLTNNGERTLIINDEAHHLMNKPTTGSSIENKNQKLWSKFLDSKKYNFKYILNSTGTPYIGNFYFKDVIYRYSIREAIKEKYVKDILYLAKDEVKSKNDRFEAIYQNHKNNKEQYAEAKKHITIFVTNKIANTDDIAKDVVKFLVSRENISQEEAEKKVIAVTSSSKHAKNIPILENVDQNEIEWIVSVSMLTEGWDVKNVFQIVPQEERAFNSKLLIAQVLGRGLRVPEEYIGKEQPKVTIYNHDKWSSKISNLVLEVTEIGKRVTSKVDQKSKYNFVIYKMDHSKQLRNIRRSKVSKVSLPTKFGFISKKDVAEQIYKSVSSGEEEIRKVELSKKDFLVEIAVNDIFNSIYLFDLHNKTEFSKRATKKYIKKIITAELKKIGEKTVTEENIQRAKTALSGLYRQFSAGSEIIPAFKEPKQIDTKELGDSTSSLHELKYGMTLLYSDLDDIPEKDLIEEDYENLRVLKKCKKENYKTPTGAVFLSSKPEVDFAKRLVRKENVKTMDAWIKSKDRGFYSVPYYPTSNVEKDFNPDFLIKIDNNILVVEIKDDKDTTQINSAKSKGAEDYFRELNAKQKKQKYWFYFLSPEDYTSFFNSVIQNKKYNWRGTLHADL